MRSSWPTPSPSCGDSGSPVRWSRGLVPQRSPTAHSSRRTAPHPDRAADRHIRPPGQPPSNRRSAPPSRPNRPLSPRPARDPPLGQTTARRPRSSTAIGRRQRRTTCPADRVCRYRLNFPWRHAISAVAHPNSLGSTRSLVTAPRPRPCPSLPSREPPASARPRSPSTGRARWRIASPTGNSTSTCVVSPPIRRSQARRTRCAASSTPSRFPRTAFPPVWPPK